MGSGKFKKLGVLAAGGVVLDGAMLGGAVSDRLFGYKLLDKWWPQSRLNERTTDGGKVRIVTEESVVVEVAQKVSPSVVTVGISKTQTIRRPIIDFDPFPASFGFFRLQTAGGRT